MISDAIPQASADVTEWCDRCTGSGVVWVHHQSVEAPEICLDCRGSGRVA